jgi:hypothetical protein
MLTRVAQIGRAPEHASEQAQTKAQRPGDSEFSIHWMPAFAGMMNKSEHPWINRYR